MNARRCAFEALMRVEKGGAYSTLAVSAQLKECEEQDKALASALFYSVLENRELLDYIIAALTVQGKRPEPKVMQILRLGLCQLLYFDSIPESAAVNECVKLCKTVKLSYATGFVNGVLRSFLRNSCGYALPDERKDYTKYISVKYSCPMWIVKLWASAYGKELCLKTASSLAGRPPVFARVNTLKTDTRGLIEALRSEGVEAQETGDGNAVCLPACGDIERLESYKNGLFHIQDLSSQRCCGLLEVFEGSRCADVCAAPGGKSFTLAQLMNNSGELLSGDNLAQRVLLIASGAQRLGIRCIRPTLRDAQECAESESESFDRVLCDVPCSGLGIIRRKPDIKLKTPEEIRELYPLQRSILAASARLVKSGGVLVYSTCTLNPEENGRQVEEFLAAHEEFEPYGFEAEREINEAPHELTVFPSVSGGDGFYTARMRRKERGGVNG